MGKIRRPSRDRSISIAEDDGTQVERDTKKTRRATKSREKVDPTVTRGALKEFVGNACKVGVAGLMTEFAKLRAETQPIGKKPKTAFDANVDKNRYKDVYCVDATRVQLTFPEGGSDYIHANWVNGGDGTKKFICTQGPTAKTVEDFWRMVWQEKCKSIIMLCNEMECGKKKCERYWPDKDNTTMTLECKLNLKFLKSEDLEKHLTLTKVEVTLDDSRLVVEHIQWKDWPDRGVPETSLSVFRLLTRIGKLAPCVVHCSAGIGRTGTVVGIDIVYSKLEKGTVSTLNDVVRELREVRHGSVQTDVQYLYMHRILMSVAENKKAVTGAEVEKFIHEYEAMLKSKGA